MFTLFIYQLTVTKSKGSQNVFIALTQNPYVIQLLGHCDLRSVPLLRMSDIIVGNCVWDKCLTGLNNEVIILTKMFGLK